MSADEVEATIVFPKGHLKSFAERLLMEEPFIDEGRATMFPITVYKTVKGIDYYMLDIPRMYADSAKNGINTRTNSETGEVTKLDGN